MLFKIRKLKQLPCELFQFTIVLSMCNTRFEKRSIGKDAHDFCILSVLWLSNAFFSGANMHSCKIKNVTMNSKTNISIGDVGLP